MEYHGKLYGKIGGWKHFDTGKTTDDYDNLELHNKQLLEACEEALTFIGNEENSQYGQFGIKALLTKAINYKQNKQET